MPAEAFFPTLVAASSLRPKPRGSVRCLNSAFFAAMQSDSTILLSIVVPVYNEELIIEELVRRMVAAAESITPQYEIIFVNDGSRDSSLLRLKAACAHSDRLHYINFSRNFGHQIAI